MPLTQYSDADSEITSGLEVIRLTDVRARIAELKPYYLAYADAGIAEEIAVSYVTREEADAALADLFVEAREEEAEELEALHNLLDRTRGASETAFLVNEDAMTDFAEEEAEDHVDSAYTCFIDFGKLSLALMQDMTRVEFRGSVFWMRG